MIAPGAALLSPRGKVLENGMPRFFRRLAEGVFDEEDVRRRAQRDWPTSYRRRVDAAPDLALQSFSIAARWSGLACSITALNIAAAMFAAAAGGTGRCACCCAR
jgi:hypothetical protein